jgi:hypothetical protein
MHSDSGATTSYWMNVQLPHFGPLAADTQADVCIILRTAVEGARSPGY